MKCPCCGKDMFMDSHTKIDKYMCYDCGYMEGRREYFVYWQGL